MDAQGRRLLNLKYSNDNCKVVVAMTRIRISMALLLASLILLITYAVDEITETSPSIGERHVEETESTETGERHEERVGFLPFSEAIRGGVFTGGAIVMSIIGYVVGREEPSFAVRSLLLINGAVVYAIMVIIVLGVSLNSGLIERDNEPLVIGSVFTVGALLLIALGLWETFPKGRPPANKVQD